MSDSIKHQTVSRTLLEEISVGKYKPGKRLPSETELSRRFGISRPTIARAMRDLESTGIIERRAGSGTYLRETAEKQVRSTVKRLDLVFPDLPHVEIFENIGGALASLARVHGFHMPWGNRKGLQPEVAMSIEEVNAWCDEAVEKQSMGVFFAPMEHLKGYDMANHDMTQRLRQAGIPVVLIDRDFEAFPNSSSFDLVAVDHFRGAFLLTEHLIKLGCKNFAFVRVPSSPSTINARIAGVRAALAENHLPETPGFLRTGDPASPSFIRDLTAGHTYDVIVAANDRIAARILQTLTKIGVRVPHDIRLVGFDDLRYAALLSVPLTTIHQPCNEIAQVAFKAMQDRLTEPALPPRNIYLSPRLVVRESCGAYLSHVHSN